MDKRFIEESFPVKEISEESVREKNVKFGNVLTFHIWWARRPLTSSRASNYAALIPASIDEIDWVKKRNFIIDLSKWDNSLNKNILEKAKQDIINANDGNPPKVLDPFSGGGAIPLEALRLGCETYVNDLNPVAVLIEKCLLEYPRQYSKKINSLLTENNNVLFDHVENWGKWILNKTKEEIGEYFPKENDGYVPISYIWARTIKCQNPSCEAEIPLIRQFWLSNKKNRKIALKPFIDNNKLEFKIIGPEEKIPTNFDPSKGTVSRAIAHCLVCGSNVEAKLTREQFQKGSTSERLIAVVMSHPKKKGKKYRIASDKDLIIFDRCKKYLELKRNKLNHEWGFDPVPDEPLTRVPVTFGVINVWVYGMKKWGDIFNARQTLTLITLTEKIKLAYQEMIDIGYDQKLAKVISTYLAFTLDNFAEKNNTLNRWVNNVEAIAGCYRMQALPMAWEYAEGNFLHGAISWNRLNKAKIKNLIKWEKTYSNEKVVITNASATNLPYEDEYFDAVFTDPPYYDNVPYSYLSDFFYVWLKRSIGNLYPELFSTPLSPKSNEIVAYTKQRTWEEAKSYFEEMLKNSFIEISRILKPNGIATIVYAHKTTDGWETLINSLLDSNLVVTATWPINTESKTRFRAKSSASLASSIYIIARKIDKEGIGFFKDVRKKIIEYVPHKLDKLWEEGISGADFFIAAIGSSIEIFGKYERVLDNEGNEIRADKFLTFVRDVVTDYTVRQILHNGIADELSPLTKFYLMWRWNYQESRIPFDEARKLSQSAGINLTNEWNKGFILKRGQFIQVIGPSKREIKSLLDSRELIDVLHLVCILWKDGKGNEMKSALKKSGFGEGEALYKVAQAISETLPNNSSEKRMIEGFLAGRDKIMQDMREDDSQTKLV